MIKKLELVCWIIAGLTVLLSPKNPDKLVFGLVWGTLILHIITNILRN